MGLWWSIASRVFPVGPTRWCYYETETAEAPSLSSTNPQFTRIMLQVTQMVSFLLATMTD